MTERERGIRAAAVDQVSESTQEVLSSAAKTWDQFSSPLEKLLQNAVLSSGGRRSGGSGGNAAAGLDPFSRQHTLPASTFGALFAEIVAYFWDRADHLGNVTDRLTKLGHDIGMRYIELIMARASPGLREPHVEKMLQFISSTAWKHLFGKPGDGLEKSTEHENSCKFVHFISFIYLSLASG